MEKTADEFVTALLSAEAHEQPSDSVAPEQLEIHLPKWFDEEKFNKGRKFFWANCFALSTSMLMGLVAVFAVPSILRILVSTRRSNSVYTAYRRYLSTLLHTMSWFEHELKPGSTSWKSLYAVRSRHLRAGLAAKLKGIGVVSQRDIALTQFGFIGFSLLKPDKFGIRQLQPNEWDDYVHVWRVIGYMIGLEDKYNICRPTVEETRLVCRQLLERVYRPCLENVPEHFEHAARVMLEGMWHVNPTINNGAALYFCRHLADVPGYIYTEDDRIRLQTTLQQHLKDKPADTGVDSTALMQKPAVDGLPARPPRLLRPGDYESIDAAPEYNSLTFLEKYKLNFNVMCFNLYSTYLGRMYFNLHFLWSVILMKYFPYLAFFKFGVKQSYVNIFVEDPVDDTELKPNSEYNKPKPPETWYQAWLSLVW